MPFRLFERLSSLFCACLFALVPGTAFAVVPMFVGMPVVGNPSFNGVPNTMMYTVTVTVDGFAADADHAAVVGFTDDYTTCAGSVWKYSLPKFFDTTATRTWTLYNFEPGQTYYYKVRVGPPTGGTARMVCGELTTMAAPTPTLPANLANLNLVYDKAGPSNRFRSRYVLMETDDCGATATSTMNARDYLIVVDPLAESIVWYLDLRAMTNLPTASSTGWRYQPGTTVTSGRILMTMNKRYLYEWSFDGTQVSYGDFAPMGECDGTSGADGPCIHHDAYKSDVSGNTYVLSSKLAPDDAIGTEWEDMCGATSRFIDDGYQVLNRRYMVTSDRFLMDDYMYDPSVDGGPNAEEDAMSRIACESVTWDHFFDSSWGMIDWTHANSLAGSRYGTMEVLDLSVKGWDEVVRINAMTGARLWTLSSHPDWSDWGEIQMATGITGEAAFADQHDAHAVSADAMMMFDNLGDPAGARVLRITMAGRGASRTATIDRSWAVVDAAGDPLYCPLEGSGQEIQDTSGARVLANCNDEYTVVELSDSTGATGSVPPLAISLPDGTSDDFCLAGGPTDRSRIRGWHRSFPLSRVGEF